MQTAMVRQDMEITMTTKRWLMGAGAGTLLMIGALGAGPVATLAQSEPDTSVTTEVAGEDQENDSSYVGTIRVEEPMEESSEADEQAALEGLAKISADDAVAAAITANPGTQAGDVELEDENGWLVYDVELSNGLDVKVDAGNGTILATEAEEDDAEEADAGEEEDAGENDAEESDDAPDAESPTAP